MTQSLAGLLSLVFLVTVLFGCGSKPSPMVGHGEVGNGGDPLALEFMTRAYFVAASLEATSGANAILTPKQLQLFKEAIPKTEIEVTDQPLVDNHQVPETAVVVSGPHGKRIRLNRERWRVELAGGMDQVGFVSVNRMACHEYCRVIDVDDDGGRVCGRLALSQSDYQAWRGKVFGLEPDSDPMIAALSPGRDFSLAGTGVIWIGGPLVESGRIAVDSEERIVFAKVSSDLNIGSQESFRIYRFTEWGGTDPGFGQQGRVTVPGIQFAEGIRGLFVQKNGTILVVTGSYSYDAHTQIFAFKSDGTPSGRIDAGYWAVHAAVLGPDDSLLLAGTVGKNGYLVHYDKNGKVIGKGLNIFFGEGASQIDAITFDQQGRILTAGAARDRKIVVVARWLPNHELDTSFGQKGTMTFGVPGYGSAIAMQGDKVVVTANLEETDGTRGAVARLNSDGSLDRNFGKQGSMQIPAPRVEFSSLVVTDKGDLIVGGWLHPQTKTNSVQLFSALAMVKADGSDLDYRFAPLGMTPSYLPGAGPTWVTQLLSDGKARLLIAHWAEYRGWAIERMRLPSPVRK